jgi:hypothetical protein
LDEELLRSILDFAGLLLEDKQSINIAEATCFGDKYNLNWERGTELFRLMLYQFFPEEPFMILPEPLLME